MFALKLLNVMSVELKLCQCHGLWEPRTQGIEARIWAKQVFCGANSLLLQEEYFSYSGNDSFHDYIHHMH